MDSFGRNLTEVAVLFITAAIVTLLVSHYRGTTAIIGQSGQTFGNLMSIVENPGGGTPISNNGFVPYSGIGFGSSFNFNMG
jgi:hypothetical protein